jgi:hypothetical protein
MGHLSPWKKLIEQLITKFAIEQLRRLQFLFNNDLSVYNSDIFYFLLGVYFLI